MKRFAISVIVVLFSGITFAQTRAELYNRFDKSISRSDSTAIVSLIEDWEKLYPDDAELYSVRANYYFMNAINKVTVMSDKEPTDGRRTLVFLDSLGVTRYMYTESHYNTARIGLAEGTLAEGIAKYPDRLDLRLGKVAIHLQAKENALAAREIESALERSVVNKNKWLGTLDKPIKTNGVSYLRECIQDYFVGFINADDMTSAGSIVDAAISLCTLRMLFSLRIRGLSVIIPMT